MHELNYNEARDKLKEVEILLSHRAPIKLSYKELDDSATMAVGAVTLIMVVGPSIAFSVFLNPLFALIPVIPIGIFIARIQDGSPKKGFSSIFPRLFLTKKQRSIQAESYRVRQEYSEQRKIFELFVQQKIENLKSEGVFEVLHKGIQESYPWINEQTGEVRELIPRAWKAKHEKLELSNNLSTKENLRELLASNPEIIKSLT